MSELFKLWVKGCETNGTEIYPLEGNGDHGLYMTRGRIPGTLATRWIDSYTSPVYRVWIHGETFACTLNRQNAYAVWENHKGDPKA